MAYQMNKDTKILLALLVVVVLCSAKLFKDYLYRNRYVEGMTVDTQESSVQLRRPASGSLSADITFVITLGAPLSSSQTLNVGWTGAAANDIVLSSTNGSYTATNTGGYTFKSALTSNGSPVIFTPSINVPSGTQIKIKIAGITIYSKSADSAGNKLSFTFNAGNEAAVTKDVNILSDISTGTSQYTASTSASVADIQAAIQGINTRLSVTGINGPNDTEITNLTNARTALITLLASTYGTIKEAGQVFESGALYEAQKTAIAFITNEKARAASNAAALSGDNLNKRRMAQINTYYTRNYEANTAVMKKVIYVSVALITLAVLRKKELIPDSISTLGVIFILTMGGIMIGGQVFDIMRRNDHDFDKYDWNFNEDQLNQQKLIQKNSDTSSLSDMGIGGAPCYGASCCDIGTVWDAASSRCVPGSRITGSSSWSKSESSLYVSLKIGAELDQGDLITVKLPPGLFTGTPGITSGVTGSIKDSASTDETVIVKVGAKIPIGWTWFAITGLTMSAGATSSTKVITAFTSKETNPSSLGAIEGL